MTIDLTTLVTKEMKLASVKDARIAMLSQTCASEILKGFKSIALGSQHEYPSSNIDQQNLAASVIASLLPSLPPGWTTVFPCADASGAWADRPHTAPQIQQVGADAKTAITALREKFHSYVAQVNAASDAATVESIVWVD